MSQVRLQRDALSTPWGFRLQGGKDFKTQLTVQRVFVGSPADGELHRGDIILGINSYDASQMIHKQAQDIIKNSGGTLDLIVRKATPGAGGQQPVIQPLSPQHRFVDNSPYRSNVLDTFIPKPAPPIGAYVTDATQHQRGYSQPASQRNQGFTPYQFGTDYSQPNSRSYSAPPPRQRQAAPGSMLNKVQTSLTYGAPHYDHEQNGDDHERVPVNQLKQVFNQPNYATLPEDGAEEEEEPRKSVKELKQSFNQMSLQKQGKPVRSRPRPASHSPGAKLPWVKAPTSSDTAPPPDPGWTPYSQQQPTRHVAAPRQASAPARPHYQQQPQVMKPAQPRYPAPPQVDDMGRPAWAGSLKSSGGPKPWEMREGAQIASGGPSGIPPAPQEPVNVHQPRVQNVHYGPGGDGPVYQQQADGGASDNAHVAHLQYNTPIGLYSRDNVDEVLRGQTQGRPGEGTMQVTGGGPGGKKPFDPTQSEVLRMLQEEEGNRSKPRGYGLQPGGGQQHASSRSPQQQPSPGQQYHQPEHHGEPQQSPMMHLLENQMAEDVGTSDF